MNLHETTLPDALRESNVADYFKHAPEQIKAQPVLGQPRWHIGRALRTCPLRRREDRRDQ